MRFVNESEDRKTFTLRGVEYTAEPFGEVEVPDKFGYAIALMKLPLRCVSGPVAEHGKPDEPETLELWRERALTERRRAESAEASARRLSDRLSDEQAAKAKVLGSQGADEERLREELAAFKAQAVELQGQLAAVTADRDELLLSATKPDAGGKPAKTGTSKPS